MSSDHRVTPYWERLPRFLLYPVQPPALWLVLIVGLGQGLTIIALPFLLQWFVLLGLLLIQVRYGYEVLEVTAEGYLQPPPTSREVLLNGYELPVKQFIVIVCGLLVAYMAGSVGLGQRVDVAVTLVVYALLPASVIVLAWTKSLSLALNPAMLWQLVAAMRWHYGALVGLLLLLDRAPAHVVNVLPPQLFPFPGVFVMTTVQTHVLLILFHLMGYFLLQFGGRLGIEPVGLETEEGDTEDYSLFEQFMERGQHAAALGEIKEIASRRPDDMALQRRVHRTAQLAGDSDTMARAADKLIADHLRAGRETVAAEIAAETLAQMTDYRPQQGDLFLGLARGLRVRGHAREAIKLCNGFHKHFPEHPDIPELYGLVARIFREDLNQEPQYDAICRFLKQHYPDHPTTISVTAFHRSGIS